MRERILIKKILVLGDSHSHVFNYLKIRNFLYAYRFNVFAVGGATASGLENPNTKTDSYKIYHQALQNESYHCVLTMLGEVDTGFVIWYRCQKKEISLEESIEKTINTYCNFLNKIQSSKVVISAPLPTIRDNQDWGEIANLRKEVIATQKERTELTLLFNSRMEKFCISNSIKYLNLDQFVLGHDGLIKGEYYSQDKNDHHYDMISFKKLLAEKLKKYL
jgi:hypothetical protein